MFKNIIYATDGSEHARKALNYARDLTKMHQAKLFVVHAYQSVVDLLGHYEYDTIMSHRIAFGEKIIADTITALEADELEIETELLEGPMAEAILRVAEARQADLIILGARGLSTLQGLVLGSVSQKIIQHASCPVLVVR